MELMNFDFEFHYNVICKWWKAWKMPIVPINILPKTGLMINHDKIPICAGFIYSTDSDLVYVDSLVANPWLDKKDRENALDIMFQALIDKTKEIGKKWIVFNTNIKSVEDRAIKFGGKVYSHNMTFITKEVI